MKNHLLFVLLYLIANFSVQAQSRSLANLLWRAAGGRVDISANDSSQYEVVDDAKNGCLKIAFIDDGCDCYNETVIGAYKDSKSNYTTLQMDWEGCGCRKTLSSNKVLNSFIPEDFGLQAFLPKSTQTEYQITSSVFFLEVEIPQKGTNTKINLSYIPLESV